MSKMIKKKKKLVRIRALKTSFPIIRVQWPRNKCNLGSWMMIWSYPQLL